MANAEEEMLRMSERLRVLEDEREIIQLISSYGPAVDSGQSEAVAAIWTEDGMYETDLAAWRGRADIAGMVEGNVHQKIIAEGAAHVLSVPHFFINGNRAVATCYSRVFRHGEGGFETWRVTASRWELVRTEEGWRTAYRVNRLLDGSRAARDLLARAGEL